MIAKSIGRPHTTLSSLAVHSIDKPKALGLQSILPIIPRIAQQARRHARPESEDDKRNEVARGHGPSSCFIQRRPCRDATAIRVDEPRRSRSAEALARSSQVVENDKEEDSAGDVNERIDSVDPVQ